MKTCHKGAFWTPRLAGSLPLRYLSFRHTSISTLPVADNDLSTFTTTEKGSTQRFYLTVVLQREGSVLDAVVLGETTVPKAADLNALGTLAAITGKRLAAI